MEKLYSIHSLVEFTEIVLKLRSVEIFIPILTLINHKDTTMNSFIYFSSP